MMEILELVAKLDKLASKVVAASAEIRALKALLAKTAPKDLPASTGSTEHRELLDSRPKPVNQDSRETEERSASSEFPEDPAGREIPEDPDSMEREEPKD